MALIKKRILVISIFFLFAPIIIGLSAELYFRIFNPQAVWDKYLMPYEFSCFTKGSYYSIALKSGCRSVLSSNLRAFRDVIVKTNNYGLRGPEFDIEKKADTIRVLFVGDSYTFGWGVSEEDSYPSIIEKTLQLKYPDRNIEIINAGLPTAGPGYYYLYLKNDGIKLDADIIVVGFYLFNDIVDNSYYSKWLEVDDQGLPVKIDNGAYEVDLTGGIIDKEIPPKYQVPILKNSHFFIYLADRMKRFTEQASSKDRLISLGACFYKKDCHRLDEVKEKTKKLFIAMKNISKGRRFLVTFIPSELQFDRKARVKYGIETPFLSTDRDYPYDYFKEFFRENNIDFLDIRPSFASDVGKSYYFAMDNHWNEEGHKAASEAIAGKLEEYIK